MVKLVLLILYISFINFNILSKDKCKCNKYKSNKCKCNKIEENNTVNSKDNEDNGDKKDDNDKKEDKKNIVKDDQGNEINLNNYILIDDIKKPEYFIDFSKLKDEDKKIKFIFLTKPIEWGNWWCWMISEIQSLFSVPLFFEYIANGNFKEERFKKLKKLQELLLEMIKNQNDPSTKKFSEEKFEHYYKYFIDDIIITTGTTCKFVNKKEYYKFIKYGEGGGLYSFCNYLNIIKCFYFHIKYNYENSNIIYQGYTNLPLKSFGKDYWKCNNIDEFKNKIEDYYKNKNLRSKIVFKFLGDDYFKKFLNKIDINDYTNYQNINNNYLDDFIFILDENIKNEFKRYCEELDKNRKDLTKYCNIIDDIFNKFDFELNSIIVHPADNHVFNINYNNNDKCFYSYNTLGGEEFKKLTKNEVIDFINNNPVKIHGTNSVFFISVKKK